MLAALPVVGSADERTDDPATSSAAPSGTTSQSIPAPGSLSPMLVQALAPALAQWIVMSRDEAIAQGVESMPPEVRKALEGYVPDAILDKARWRVGGGDGMSLQYQIVEFGDVHAVTLDHVVVFKDAKEANNSKLWAHEIRHVMQFADWGVTGFARRYLTNYEAVEKEAADYRWEWMKERGLIPVPGESPSTN